MDEIDIDPVDAGKFACQHCERTFNAERGLQVHMGRDHKEAYAEEKAAKIKTEAKRSTTSAAAKPLIGKSGKFDRDAAELMVDLLAAGLAWVAVQWITGQGIPLTASEREAFVPDAASRKLMFRPLMDGLESVKPVTTVVNTLASKMDYIQCFLAWKEYLSAVSAFAAERKETLEQNHGIVANGPQQDDLPPTFASGQQSSIV